MALKYYIDYTTKGSKPDDTFDIVTHRLEIYNDDFTGDATEIKGSVTLVKVSDKDVLKATRGGGLNIQLEANSNLTFEDFYTENERQFSVKYIRNSITLFYGWLSPEGLFEDYINDNWVISLNCTDGIGFLNNLQYINNTTKEVFTGKQSLLEVISNCLKRTNLDMNIYTSINIFYEDQSLSTDTFDEVFINADRFIKDDNDTVMNCSEVLTSVLEIFGATITQYKGGWYIYKANELYDNSELTFFGYDEDGTALSPTTYTIDFAENIGSRKDNYYPHFVNRNQKITIDNSLAVYRINYKYGLVKSFFENTELVNVSGSVDEWTINDATNLTFPTNDKGFLLKITDYSGLPLPAATLLATSDSFSLSTGNLIEFTMSFQYENSASNFKLRVNNYIKIILDDGAGTLRYLSLDGEWSTTDSFINLSVYYNLQTINLKSKSVPVDGTIYIELYTPLRLSYQGTYQNNVIVHTCNFSPVVEDLKDVQGETFTFENTSSTSTKIAENKEVFNGDAPTDAYVGTIYENDETTPTEYWFRNVAELHFAPILQIMGEERMSMYGKPTKIFSGDIYGYIDFLSLVTINNLEVNNYPLKFMPIEYSYNSAKNITTLKLKEILDENNDGVYDNIQTISAFDYGETTKPTIKN